MGYALFAQRKLFLTAQLNCLNMQQTQRANEQLQLATNTLSLQKQLTSLQTAQATQLAQQYERLAESGSSYKATRDEGGELKSFTYDYWSYDEADGKILDNGTPITAESAVDDKGKSEEYENRMSKEREQIQAKIQQIEQKFKVEEDVINRQIYQVSIKENAIEMEVKRLDTKITAVQKQLEAVQEAEGAGIDRATPKFNGIG